MQLKHTVPDETDPIALSGVSDSVADCEIGEMENGCSRKDSLLKLTPTWAWSHLGSGPFELSSFGPGPFWAGTHLGTGPFGPGTHLVLGKCAQGLYIQTGSCIGTMKSSIHILFLSASFSYMRKPWNRFPASGCFSGYMANSDTLPKHHARSVMSGRCFILHITPLSHRAAQENADYVKTLAENSAAKDLLGMAKKRLQKFYQPKAAAASFVQVEAQRHHHKQSLDLSNTGKKEEANGVAV